MGHVAEEDPVARTGTEPERVPRTRARLRWYVAATLAGAVIAAAAVFGLAPAGTAAATWPLALALGLAMVLGETLQVKVRLAATVESSTLVELFVVPLMVLFEPSTAVLVVGGASVVAETLVSRREPLKGVFNVGWLVTAAALGSTTYGAIAGTGAYDGSARSVVAALAAAGVFVAWNAVSVAGVVAIAARRSWYAVVREEPGAALRLNLAIAVVGVLVASLVRVSPAGLPLLALVGLLLHQRQRERQAVLDDVATERDRLDRTVAGSSDGVVLLDAVGRVEVWNPAMRLLTGIESDVAVGARLGELGWQDLTAATEGAGEGEELRLQVTDRVLAVRRAVVPGGFSRSGGTVITVRDVSRETELARIQDDLVSRISHELRTPLTSVEGFLEVLLRHGRDLDAGGQAELLHAAHRGARRLSRLVENLVGWAGIESRRDAAPCRRGVCDPLVVLGDVLAESPLDDVRVEVDDDVEVALPEPELASVLGNLIANVEVYGATPVSVIVRRRGDEVDLAVTDAGPGVPPEFRPRLFEPLAQASDGLQRTAKGLGFGLPLVRALVEGAGGTVRHEAPPEGGARFVVTLPAARPAQPAGDGRPAAVTGTSASSS